jgi:DUF4097 and DUF4098 domain-containing protein YvlB
MSTHVKQARWRLPLLVMAGLALSLNATGSEAQAQVQASDGTDRLTIHLSDPSRPGSVKASQVRGGITVKGYDGKDILIEARARDEAPVHTEPGMHRLSVGTTGLTAEEDNNEVNITTDSVMHLVDLTITVPMHTSLSLHAVTDGNISVTGVDGDIEVSMVNGTVTLTNISGSTVTHSVNGKILATFAHVNPGKAMAFSSINGQIDVTFPADLKANLSLHSERGDVFSDFDVQLQRSQSPPIVEDSGTTNGKYRVKTDGSVHGTINGGGADIQMNNLNGNIYIRKAGAAH